MREGSLGSWLPRGLSGSCIIGLLTSTSTPSRQRFDSEMEIRSCERKRSTSTHSLALSTLPEDFPGIFGKGLLKSIA